MTNLCSSWFLVAFLTTSLCFLKMKGVKSDPLFTFNSISNNLRYKDDPHKQKHSINSALINNKNSHSDLLGKKYIFIMIVLTVVSKSYE